MSYQKTLFSGNCHLLIWRQNHLETHAEEKLLNLKLKELQNGTLMNFLRQNVEIRECEKFWELHS